MSLPILALFIDPMGKKGVPESILCYKCTQTFNNIIVDMPKMQMVLQRLYLYSILIKGLLKAFYWELM